MTSRRPWCRSAAGATTSGSSATSSPVPAPTARPLPELREHLREVLPDYMVPSAFVVLPALPLTGSGKIDHRALPEPDWGAVPGQVPVAPRTPTESRLAAIMAELLGLPAPVGVH